MSPLHPMAAQAPPFAGTPTKRMLGIGIDDYSLSDFHDLQGCVNDVLLLQRLLVERFGFAPARCRTLFNRQASRTGIFAALELLLAETRHNDIVALIYAGHGSRRKARPGVKTSGWHETLVPCDSGRSPRPNLDITDDELRLWLLRMSMKTPFITVILDSCHSATAHRTAVPGLRERWVEADLRPAGRAEGALAAAEEVAAATSLPRDARFAWWLPSPNSYTVLAACQDDERANEVQVKVGGVGRTHGVFTHALAEELGRSDGGARTYRTVLAQVSAAIERQYASQHPVVEGARDRVPFSMEDLQLQQPAHVRVGVDGRARLNRGAVHGVAVGSRWRLLPAEPADAGCMELPALHITELRPGSATGELSAAAPALGGYAFAVESFRPEPARTTVCLSRRERGATEALSPTEEQQLRDALGASPLLCITDEEEAAMIRLRPAAAGPLPPPLLSLPADGTVQTVIEVGDQEALYSFTPLRRPTAIRQVVERVAHHAWLKAERGSLQESRISLSIAHSRSAEDEDWCVLHTDGLLPRRGITVAEGSYIAVRLTHNHPVELYIALLYLSADRSVSQVYPPTGGTAACAPGQDGPWLCREEGDLLKVQRSATAGLHRYREQAPAPYELEHLKILLATEPIETSSLTQAGIHDFSAPTPGEHDEAGIVHRATTTVARRAPQWWSITVPIFNIFERR